MMIKITYIDGKTDTIEGEDIKQFNGDTFIENGEGRTVAKISSGSLRSIIKQNKNISQDIVLKLMEYGYSRIRVSKCDPYGYYISFRKYEVFECGGKREVETKVFNAGNLEMLFIMVEEYLLCVKK